MEIRHYQVEIYNKAREGNVIIKLNTGAGKTFIASMLIKDYLINGNDKKIFLLVKNTSLANQHANSLKKYLFLNKEIGVYYGQMDNSWVDNWPKDKWSEQLSKYKIIVMTARVFLDILNHNKFSLKQVCFLIFDEIHHMSKADDYVQISEHLARAKNSVKVLGLTACLIKSVKKIKDIEFNILELEKKLNCKVITSQDSMACDFSEKIKEKFIEYEIEKHVELNEEFESAIAKIKEFDTSNEDSNQSKESDGYLMEDSFVVSLKKYLSECSSVCKTLGLIPCKLIIEMFIEDLKGAFQENKISDDVSKQCLNEFLSCLMSINNKIKKILSNSDILMCTQKCKKLIQLILKIKSKTSDFKNQISILIFISERIQALALNELLALLPMINKDFDFINSNFVIGHSNSKHPKKMQMNVHKQEEILKNYKDNKFNILIATNVIEEGVDVPHCNVVIKFDPPQDFRSYVQSKGRARAQDSRYIVFTSEKLKTEIQIENFKRINNKINEVLKSRLIENDYNDNDCNENENGTIENVDSKYDFMPHGEDAARITLNSASNVLNRYIGKLRCNGISEIKVLYKYEYTESNLCQASLLLPMPSPYLDEIKGKPCSTKKRAKQFANLEACKILYEFEELDNSLLPYNRYVDDDINHSKDEQTGLINQYEKYNATKLSFQFPNDSESGHLIYLYCIKFTPSIFLKLGINDISVFDMSSSIGIILSKPIDNSKTAIKFPIYLVGGECSVEINLECSLSISSSKFSLLLQCHENLFKIYAQRIRKFNQNIFFEPTNSKCSILLVILKNKKIDFEKTEEIVNKPIITKLTENNQNLWVGSVIRPTYLPKEFGAFVVTKVCTNMNGDTILTDKKIMYKQFYKEKYNIHLTENEIALPLVKATRLTTIQSCVNKDARSLSSSKKLQKINNRENYFIPSLVECLSLPAGIWTQLCIFPTIHYRLNQILVIEEFAFEIDFMNLTDNTNNFEINFDDCYNISRIESDKFDTDVVEFVKNVFPCFVAKTCNDRINLEQFEVLGDSFLKYISAKYLYHFSEEYENEGKLTQRRSRLISNKNLFNLAISKSLEKYFFYSNFNPKNNYLPPYFVEKINNIEKDCRKFISIKNKNLADCVEALVGSILTNYGSDHTLKFLFWLGLYLMPDNEENIEIKVIPPEIFLNEALFQSGFPPYIIELENILNYRFRYKAYAIQAITHPSSVINRKFSCYQRLEFLGDSVIDFLVTVHIMIHNQKLTPGKITNLRSALVNNNTFAYLSVKWGFHKFLNYFDSKLFHVLPNVVDQLLSNHLEASNSFLRTSQEYKVVVKILGDIFESIAGAIFVDSDYDLETVWKIYKRLMDEPLRKFSTHIPKNKLSMLHEQYPQLKCVFEIEEFSNLVKLTATLPNGVIIEKIERNKTLCKLALAEELEI